jgi:5-(carboxyamino)imidazole ribonucleotide synthase
MDWMNMANSIGIIGGGQLGKMLAEAAKRLENPPQVAIYDVSTDACAKDVCDSFTCGLFDDKKAIKEFAKDVAIITYEFENIDPEVVASLEHAVQGSQALGILQNRVLEKAFINSLPGLQCVPYKEVDEDFTFAYPYIVKSATLGYDGKGQYVIRDEKDLHHIKVGMIAETYLDNITEYSIIIARNLNGEVTHYPVVENVHVNQILDTSKFASIDPKYEQRMFEKAKIIAQALNYYGVLTVEFFLNGDQLYVNEVAPRVHNSGHITLDGANVSQFDLHLYSLLGREYPTIEIDRSWCMVNVLGQHYERVKNNTIPGKFYDYGKNSTQHNRKVGHINGLLKDLNRLKEARIR